MEQIVNSKGHHTYYRWKRDSPSILQRRNRKRDTFEDFLTNNTHNKKVIGVASG